MTTTGVGVQARNRRGLRPCTASGVIAFLKEIQVNLVSVRAIVVGRSELVGRPLARMPIQKNATFTTAHSRTRNLTEVTGSADIVIVAAGIHNLISTSHI